LFNQLDAAGVDYEDVVATLERDGIEKFVASFNQRLKRVSDATWQPPPDWPPQTSPRRAA
jgi:hypothetical protein